PLAEQVEDGPDLAARIVEGRDARLDARVPRVGATLEARADELVLLYKIAEDVVRVFVNVLTAAVGALLRPVRGAARDAAPVGLQVRYTPRSPSSCSRVARTSDAPAIDLCAERRHRKR